MRRKVAYFLPTLCADTVLCDICKKCRVSPCHLSICKSTRERREHPKLFLTARTSSNSCIRFNTFRNIQHCKIDPSIPIMRNILLILTALSLPTSSLGFVAHQSHSQLAKLNGCVTTWSDYQQQHLDSLSTDYASVDLVPFDVLPDATLSKATNARAYWKELVKSSKANLHSMKAQEDVNEWSRHAPGHTENWVHYKNALDALIPHHQHSTTDAFHWPKHASSASWSDYKEMVGGLAMPEVDLDKKQGTFCGILYKCNCIVLLY